MGGSAEEWAGLAVGSGLQFNRPREAQVQWTLYYVAATTWRLSGKNDASYLVT